MNVGNNDISEIEEAFTKGVPYSELKKRIEGLKRKAEAENNSTGEDTTDVMKKIDELENKLEFMDIPDNNDKSDNSDNKPLMPENVLKNHERDEKNQCFVDKKTGNTVKYSVDPSGQCYTIVTRDKDGKPRDPTREEIEALTDMSGSERVTIGLGFSSKTLALIKEVCKERGIVINNLDEINRKIKEDETEKKDKDKENSSKENKPNNEKNNLEKKKKEELGKLDKQLYENLEKIKKLSKEKQEAARKKIFAKYSNDRNKIKDKYSKKKKPSRITGYNNPKNQPKIPYDKGTNSK